MTIQKPAPLQSPAFLYATAWAESYELTDLQLSPLGIRAIDALNLRTDDVVLDIGCGAGQTLMQIAERVGSHGQVIGVEVAPMLIELAELRTGSVSQVTLIQADAQRVDLPTGSADAVFSRFGVMSFDDPVEAFTNFYRTLNSSGTLAFTCWRSLRENELDYLPIKATGFEAMVDETPFSFAQPEHIRQTLEAAGFIDINIQPYDEKVSCGDIDATTAVLLKVGPLGKIIRENPDLQKTAEPLLRDALAVLGDTSNVRLRASIWIVTAQAGKN